MLGFPLRRRHHINRIPWAALEKSSLRPFAGTQLATDTKERVNDNAPEGRMIKVGRPIHAILHGAIVNAGRRPRAARAALVNYRQNVWLSFAFGSRALGGGFVLNDLAGFVFGN